MKHIVLPTDFSDNARHACRYAINLYKGQEVTFHLIHSFEPPHPTGMLIRIDDILKKEALQNLKNEQVLLEKDLHDGQKLGVDAVVGELNNVTNQVIRKNNAELIVMGTKGATGLKEIFVGSNASEIIQSAIKPVLAIPEDAAIKKPETFVLAADYENLNDISVLEPLRSIVKSLEGKLMVVNVKSTDDGEIVFNPVTEKLAIEDYFEDVDHSYHEIQNESVSEGLNDFLNQNDADVLAMIPEKNNFFMKIFHKSVTKQMVLHSQIPLLSLRI